MSVTEGESEANADTVHSADIVSVKNIVFPSAVCGTADDPLKQVEEVVEKMHALLTQHELGIGNMLQHTIFLKDGAASTMDVLQRFHETATRLAPSLKTERSVGTIIRLPEFPDRKAAIMLEIVAGVPLENRQAPDGYRRVPFVFGPQEIVETIGGEKIVFTAGLEAMDFEHGTLDEAIDDQIVAVVGKLDGAMKKAGLTISNVVQHNLYVTQGTDPMRVTRKFQEEVRKIDPEASDYPSVGTLMIVDGMAAPSFLLEMDAVASRDEPESLERVRVTETSMNGAKVVATGDLVYVVSMPGIDFDNNMVMSNSIDGQIEMAVRNTVNALQQAGLSFGDVVKHRIMMKKGAADPARLRARFYDVAAQYAPDWEVHPSAETFLIVEGLATDDRLFEVAVIAARK
jgi:enamine deaminase RidA (YjgF/YER057c/UK114 family)